MNKLLDDDKLLFYIEIKEQKYRHGLLGMLALIAISAPFSVAYLFWETYTLFGILLVGGLIVPSYLYFFLKKTKKYELAMNIGILCLASIITAVCFYTGGPRGPVFVYFMMIPLLSGYYLRSKQMKIWSAIAILIVSALITSDLAGYKYNNLIPEVFLKYYSWASQVCAFIVLMFYSTVYESVRFKQFRAWRNEYRQRLAKEADIEANREKLIHVQKLAKIAGWEYCVKSGDFIWSKELFQLLGITPFSSSPTQENILALLLPEERDVIAEKLKQMRMRTIDKFLLEHKILSEKGTIKHCQTEAYFNGSEENPAYHGICRDITEQKMLEIERNEYQAKMFLASKMASIGEISAGVAHEINNPLNIMQGYLDLFDQQIMHKSVDRNQLTDLSASLKSSILRIAKIVRSLKSFSYNYSNELEVFDLNPVIGDSLKLMKAIYAKEGVQLNLDISAPPLWVKASANQLQQVLLNLVSNAHDAIENQSEKKILVQSFIRNDKAVIEVRDNGPGIPCEIQDKIFQPFFTTKPPGKGTGLGLGISHYLVEKMSGQLEFHTSKEGTLFSLSLPIATSPSNLNKVENVNTTYQQRIYVTGHCLVVDDENEVNEYLTPLLESKGLQVSYAKNGREAAKMLQEQAFAFVVSDYNMPEMNGVELMEFAKTHLSTHPKFIIMTGGFSNKIEERRALNNPLLFQIIEKPFSIQDLLKLIEKAAS